MIGRPIHPELSACYVSSHLEGKGCDVLELAAINSEGKTDVCVSGDIAQLFSHKCDVGRGRGTVGTGSQMEKERNFNFCGNNRVLGDEPDLADHL